LIKPSVISQQMGAHVELLKPCWTTSTECPRSSILTVRRPTSPITFAPRTRQRAANGTEPRRANENRMSRAEFRPGQRLGFLLSRSDPRVRTRAILGHADAPSHESVVAIDGMATAMEQRTALGRSPTESGRSGEYVGARRNLQSFVGSSSLKSCHDRRCCGRTLLAAELQLCNSGHR